MKRTIPPVAFIGIIVIVVAILGGAYAVLAQPELNSSQREEYSEKQIFRRKKPNAQAIKQAPAPEAPQTP